MVNLENKSIPPQEPTPLINENDPPQGVAGENTAQASPESELAPILPNNESGVDNQQAKDGLKIENQVNNPKEDLLTTVKIAEEDPSEDNLHKLSGEVTNPV